MQYVLLVAALLATSCQDLVVHYTPPPVDEAVLALRNVDLPDLPLGALAYNASITKHNGRLLMAFRLDTPGLDAMAMQICVVQLRADFSVAGPYSVLETRRNASMGWTAEDPRLFSVGEVLYVVYNTTVDGRLGSARHINIGRVSEDAGMFALTQFAELLLPKEGATRKVEKNWTPFVFNDEIHLVHTTNPHRVVKVPTLTLQVGAPQIVVEEVALAREQVQYYFGRMRGGTPALFDSSLDSYVSVFHSSATADLGHGAKQHYFMGIYAFAKEPPFGIEAVAPYPILASSLYTEESASRHIVFPQGLVLDDDVMHVSFGRDDMSIGVVSLDKDLIMRQLRVPEPLPMPSVTK